jgi:beta-phosphoglucomutase-like phosphatase (HAD superfamily)
MLYVFDLDGTLIDSEKAVRESYKAIGVSMPVSAWGQPAGTWATQAQRNAKNECYRFMLKRYGQMLPLYEQVSIARAIVITAASLRATQVVQALYGPLNVMLTGATMSDKIRYLRTLAWSGIYVDDNPHARTRVNEETGWSSISPKDCLRSFSQPVPTPD